MKGKFDKIVSLSSSKQIGLSLPFNFLIDESLFKPSIKKSQYSFVFINISPGVLLHDKEYCDKGGGPQIEIFL